MVECSFNLSDLRKYVFNDEAEEEAYLKILMAVFDLYGYSHRPYDPMFIGPDTFTKEDANSLDDVPLQALANVFIASDIMEFYIRINDEEEYCFNGDNIEDQETYEQTPFKIEETKWFIDACRKMLNK